MAHYAYLNENNIVEYVFVGPDENNPPQGFDSWEEYFETKTGQKCKRTSYNTWANDHYLGGEPYRYNYAGLGFTYDELLGPDGAFIPPRPFDSWILNKNTAQWEAPKEKPDQENQYEWDEELGDWVLIPL